MAKSGDAPTPPNPATVIGLESGANTTAANQSTANQRYNTVGPDATQTWTNNPVFDQAGYDAATKAWQTQNPASVWIPGTDGSTTGGATATNPEGGGGDYNTTSNPGTAGYWTNPSTSGDPAPDKSAFTTNNYTLTNTLNPADQAIHDATQAAQGSQAATAAQLASGLSSQLASGPDYSGLGTIQTSVGQTPGQINQAASDAAYNNATRYLDPQVALQQKALTASLAQQGFVPGTPGYAQAMATFNNSTNQQYGAARDSATLAGQTAGAQNYNEYLQGANLNNSAVNQQLLQALQKYQNPLSTYESLMSGIPSTTFGASSGGGSTVNPADAASAISQQYQGQLANYNAGVSSDNATMGTLGSVAGIALAFL